MVTSSCQFFPGEVRLQAVKHELKHQRLSMSNFHNTDGIIMDEDSDLGIALLGTLEPFSLNYTTREIADHIKAAYGLLAMLHAIVYKHIYS